MTHVDFDVNTALTLWESNDDFPVDFDDAWQWMGYSKKDKALKMLYVNFEEGVDFSLPEKGEWTHSGRSRDIYLLTVDCFKSFCLLAGTDKGKQVRKYFIDCEKQLKKIYAQLKQDSTEKVNKFAQYVEKLIKTKQITPQVGFEMNLTFLQEHKPEWANILIETQERVKYLDPDFEKAVKTAESYFLNKMKRYGSDITMVRSELKRSSRFFRTQSNAFCSKTLDELVRKGYATVVKKKDA